MTYAKVINGQLREATEIKPIDIAGWDEIDIPPINLRYENGEYKYVEYVEPLFKEPTIQVPQTLTPRQFRLALLQEGLLDDVEAITAQNREHQIYFEYSLDFQRNHPLLATMASAMGLTEAQIDELFILGWTL